MRCYDTTCPYCGQEVDLKKCNEMVAEVGYKHDSFLLGADIDCECGENVFFATAWSHEGSTGKIWYGADDEETFQKALNEQPIKINDGNVIFKDIEHALDCFKGYKDDVCYAIDWM